MKAASLQCRHVYILAEKRKNSKVYINIQNPFSLYLLMIFFKQKSILKFNALEKIENNFILMYTPHKVY